MIHLKTPSEIKTMREGGKIHAGILAELASMAHPGVSLNEINAMALKRCKSRGVVPAFLNYRPEGARKPYPAAVCVSVNDEIVHGIPSKNARTLKEGDIVSIDLGIIHEGLITDSAVTVPVGRISTEDEHLIAATERALHDAILACRPGGFLGDIGAAVELVARKTNFKICEGLSGHGVGRSIHEDPYVPNTGIKGHGLSLRPGMVIAIEPMFAIGTKEIALGRDGYTYKTADGSNAAHFEHTVAITDDGAIVLTAS